MSEQRQVWQDRAKGIGIVLVVFGHVMRGLTGAHIAPVDASTQSIDYTLYTFHMPLFFLLAGLNVERSARRGAGSFLRDKLHTIVWPYFLWSIVQGMIQVRLAGEINIPISYGDLAAILWSPISQFWFLYVLTMCHIAYLAGAGWKAGLTFAAAIGFAFSPLAPILAGKFLFNFVFYVMGLWLAPSIGGWLDRTDRSRAIMAAVAAFAISVSVCFEAGIAFDNPLCTPAALAGIAMTALVAKSMSGAVGRIAEIIGRMSMTIYILHILAAGGARVIMQKLGVPPMPLFYALVVTAIGVGAPMIAYVAFERLGLLPWLGLAAPRRARVASTRAVVALSGRS